MIKNKLLESFTLAGQRNIFQFFDQLDVSAQTRLISQAEKIDLAELGSLIEEHIISAHSNPTNLIGLEPAPYEARPENGGEASKWEVASAAGSAAIRAGRVAAFSVAGGGAEGATV